MNNIEKLAEQNYPICDVWNEEQSLIRKLAFIKGYQSAEKELFTEEDMRKAIDIVHEWYNSRPYFLNTEQIIEQLKQPKL